MKCPCCANDVDAQAAYCQVCYEVINKVRPHAVRPPAAANGWTPSVLIAAFVLFLVFARYRAQVLEALWILDFVNLAFHECGHIVFKLFYFRFLIVFGGTAMQLILPGIVVWHFHQREDHASAYVAVWWFGQNFLGIGRYIADSCAQELPLVGGGEHDWTYLLEVLGVLTHDVAIGRVVQIFGCLIMALALAGVYVSMKLNAQIRPF